MADKPKITKEMVAEYIRQNPDSVLSYDLFPLAARAGNEYLFGAGNRLGANIAAIPALFNSKRDFGKERDFNKEVIQAVADYQKQETPAAAAAADITGLLGSAVAPGAAAPATFGANIGRITPFATRVGRTIKGAATDQAIRSLLGEGGVWEKSQVQGEIIPSREKAINALPKAIEETVRATVIAPIAGEAFRGVGKGIQKGADKLNIAGLLGKYKSEGAALKRVGLTPESVEAGRLVSGTANIPSLPEEYSQAVGKALVSGREVAESNLAKAKSLGIKMTPLEAYAPQSNVLRDLQFKAQVSPQYGIKYGEMIQDRPQVMAGAAEELRPQLQKARNELYGTVVGTEDLVPKKIGVKTYKGTKTVTELLPEKGFNLSDIYATKEIPYSYSQDIYDPNTIGHYDWLTGKQIPAKKPLTIGDINTQKMAAYGENNIPEGERLKELLRSYPEGAKAESLYGAEQDLLPILREGGINRYAPTTPAITNVDTDAALKKAQELRSVREILRFKNQKPSVNIASEVAEGSDPKLYARTPNKYLRGSADALSPLVNKLRTTAPEYFDKISNLLTSGDITGIAAKASEIAPVFQSKALSPTLGRATGAAVAPLEDKPLPAAVKPRKATLKDLAPAKPQGIKGARKATLEDLMPQTNGAFPAPEGYINLPQYQEIIRKRNQ